MEYRKLGTTDIKISTIGLGTWAIGGPNWKNGRAEGWSAISPTEVIDALEYAVANGVTHYDCADVYGNGSAERLLARGLGNNTQNMVVTSKVGWFGGTASHAYEPAHIRTQCEQSLRNLNREYLDIYYFHHGDFGKGDTYLNGAIEVMERLKSEGKIRAIGFSTYSQKSFNKLVPLIQPDVVQAWAHMLDYHFIAAESPLMKLCEKYGIGFIGYQPFDQGVLLGKYSADTPPVFEKGDHRGDSYKFKQPYLQRVQSGLDALGLSFDTTVEERARLAQQFVLKHTNVSGTIAGFRNRAQVETIIQGADRPINGDELSHIYRAFRG